MSSLISHSTHGEWVEREYVLDISNWQRELHELISTYIIACRQRNNGSAIQRGRSIIIETSVDDGEGQHYEGPVIKVPMTSVCAECFRCCRRYMVEPLVPFFERHFSSSQVLVITILYGVEDEKLPYQSDVEDELDVMWAANLESVQLDAHTDDGNDGDDDTEADTDIE
ncbi:uncharacterized protein LDX57_008768 [Aspergillus melleus]|uniref:uncharacterized protein n=1 Tax=Aspergillus melleus TaxID=138277 RepID=UPI001E8D26AC|nr:uncharacterized protein LDX57_008768 [Aspergillus melleus]KAH8431107.1 hypothetical protein LDX57_008768 [Aspergillus melleus]